ncbi:MULTISPECIES: response regulator transcription factor [Dehalococcoides]|uniref:response regulator transcription factor n=1 Tax=Dehalococcoides TaxID=61434 RepID=UPI00062D0111|nr:MULTISPECIES: response regulator transcription factor [Dehalococcoides]QYY57858.1 response regulator transcription factor [Dehalococcoides mccartyi]
MEKIILKPSKSSPKTGHCTSPVRVLLVDDHEVAREGLRKILHSESDIEIIGEADNVPDTLRLAAELKPQVVLTDIKISGTGGCELRQQLKTIYPLIKVIILTGYEAEQYATEALSSGMNGFLTKDCPLELLSNAIRVVACGGSVWQGNLLEIASKNLACFVNEKTVSRNMVNEYSSAAVSIIPQDVLSPRELEILIMVARGYTNKEISVNLNYAEITIKKYVKGIMTKLNVSNRTLAGIAAVKFGLV